MNRIFELIDLGVEDALERHLATNPIWLALRTGALAALTVPNLFEPSMFTIEASFTVSDFKTEWPFTASFYTIIYWRPSVVVSTN
jgi:hypothetical protein